MIIRGFKHILAAGFLLGLQACDISPEQSNRNPDLVFDGQSSIVLQAPEFLLTNRAIATESLAVGILVSYSANDKDYEYPYTASRSTSGDGAFWASKITVPTNVPFTLAITWFEESPRLDLVKITRQFDARSDSGRVEFSYNFSPSNEFSDEPDAPDFAGFDTDGDDITNLTERDTGTDPFDGNDPPFNTTTQLTVEPKVLVLEGTVTATGLTTLRLDNLSDGDLAYTVDANVDWLSASPEAGSVPADASLELNVSYTCTAEPAERSGNIQLTTASGIITVPVELQCSDIPTPLLSVSPSELELTVLAPNSTQAAIDVNNRGTALLAYTVESSSDWLVLLSGGGEVPPGESEEVGVVASCSTTAETRFGELRFAGNGGLITVPVVLTCTPPLVAIMEVSPETIDLSAQVDAVANDAILVRNVGTAQLQFTVESNAPWLVADAIDGDLSAGASTRIQLTGSCPAEPGTLSASLIIQNVSLSAAEPLSVSVPVTLTCITGPKPELGNVTPIISLTSPINDTRSGILRFENVGDALLSYTLSSDATWLTLPPPLQGTLESGQAAAISITAKCDSEVAMLNGSILITSDGNNASVDVSLDCRGPVLSGVSPLSFAFSATVGQTDQGSLNFSNSGNEPLSFIVSSDSNWLCPDEGGSTDCDVLEDSFSGVLEPGVSYTLPIVAKCPVTAAEYSGALDITGNITTVTIPVTLNCTSVPLLAAEAAITYVNAKTYRFTWEDAQGADYYQLLENPDGNSDYTLVSSKILQGNQQLDHVVPLHLRDRARYILETCREDQCVESTVISVEGNLVDAIGIIEGPLESGFGKSIDISGDGGTLAVFHAYLGAVSIYRKNTTPASPVTWILEDRFEPDALGGSSNFSPYSISLSQNGRTLAVGIQGSFNNSCECTSPDTVYIYQSSLRASPLNNAIVSTDLYDWTLTAELFHPEPGLQDEFGRSVSLNGSGTRIFIGSPGSNSVHVFAFGENWKPLAVIEPQQLEEANILEFGTYLQVSADKDILAVSAQLDDYYLYEESDVVYVFNGQEGTWIQEAELVASNNNADYCYGETTYCRDGFGTSLSVSGDGQTVAVGAPLESSNSSGVNGDQENDSSELSGAAYVFARNGGEWNQQAYVKASNSDVGDFFGYSVDLTYNGELLAIGAWEEASGDLGFGADETADIRAGAGAGYLFSRAGSNWQQINYFKASRNTLNLGSAIRISDDGTDLFISAGLYESEVYYY